MSKNESKANIQIDHVDPYILTSIRVDCDNFYHYFGKISHTDLNKNEVSEFLRLISELDQIDSTFNSKVDTRAKILIISNSEVKHICFGINSLEMDNICYQTTDSLVEFMSKL
jgi:hypothetical protein